MNASLRGFAGFAGAVVVAASLTWCAPALADPAPPTLESLEPPAPPPPVPAAAPNPAPAPSHAADESAIRQVVQTSVDDFNAQNWGALQGLYCSAKQATFSAGDLQNAYDDSGSIQIAVTAVMVSGDSATAAGALTDRNGSAALVWHMVREGSWRLCGN